MPKEKFEAISAGDLRTRWREVIRAVHCGDKRYVIMIDSLPVAQLTRLDDETKAAMAATKAQA